MDGWVEVAKSTNLSDDCSIEAVIEGRIVAIFRHQGELYALDGMCAHQGGPLAKGIVDGGCVTCPWHGWQYELASGIQTVNRQPLQETFDVREREGKIEVKIP